MSKLYTAEPLTTYLKNSWMGQYVLRTFEDFNEIEQKVYEPLSVYIRDKRQVLESQNKNSEKYYDYFLYLNYLIQNTVEEALSPLKSRASELGLSQKHDTDTVIVVEVKAERKLSDFDTEDIQDIEMQNIAMNLVEEIKALSCIKLEESKYFLAENTIRCAEEKFDDCLEIPESILNAVNTLSEEWRCRKSSLGQELQEENAEELKEFLQEGECVKHLESLSLHEYVE